MKKKSIIIILIIILLLCIIGGVIWYIGSNNKTADVAGNDVVPTEVPTEAPTPEPTEVPTPEPTEVPTPEPTEAPSDEQQTENKDFEDLSDEDKSNINFNDSDSTDGLPEVEDPEDTQDAPVEDEPTTPSGTRKNTVAEENIQWYLDLLGISRDKFNSMTDKQLTDAVMAALSSGGSSGGNSGGNSGGSSGGNNTSPEIDEGDDDLPVRPSSGGPTVAGEM